MNKIITKLLPFILFAAGVFFMYSGVQNYKAQQTYTPTNAVISSITSEYYNKKNHYTVMVEYDIDDIHYETALNEYDVSMYIGKPVEILYDESNPYNIVKKGVLAYLMTFGFGLLCFFCGYLIFKKNAKKGDDETA